MSGKQRTDVAVRANSEQHDVEARRSSEEANEIVGAGSRRAFRIGRIRLHPVNPIRWNPRGIKPERTGETVVGLGVGLRHRSFVTPEEVSPRPVE
jgi:hypothetical protein